MRQIKSISMLRWVIVMLIGALPYYQLRDAVGKAVVGMNNHKLIFEIKTNKHEFHLGEKIYVDLILRNTGDSPLCVNSRMAINHHSAPSQYREIELLLERKNGNKIDFDCRVNIRRATEKDYKILQPGESIIRKYEITKYFHIAKTGEYVIKAGFQDGTKAIENLNEIPVFFEKIESNLVDFFVK